jgi:hypothetical protein
MSQSTRLKGIWQPVVAADAVLVTDGRDTYAVFA